MESDNSSERSKFKGGLKTEKLKNKKILMRFHFQFQRYVLGNACANVNSY